MPGLRAASLPNGRQAAVIAEEPRRQAHRRHRRHRLPRHRPRRAAAALGPRLRAGAAGPRRAGAPRSSSGPSARSSRNDAFDRLRERARQGRLRGDGRRAGHRRSPATSAATASASTTTAGPRSPRCDIVIHSAATVSFDSPLDARRRGQPARARPASSQTLHDLGVTPHLVVVSTCYVAGNRRGAAPESPVARQPVLRRRRLARRGRRRPPGPRRRRGRQPHAPTRSPRFRKEARARARRRRHARCWPPRPSSAAQRVGEGPAWSRPAGPAPPSLGWPDAYAYTKALGERALLQNRGDVPVSIVRPSIIESALRRAAARAGSAASAWPSR